MFTIVGAGFGLYGYLPAIVNVSKSKVLLAEQYRQSIESRPELGQYAGSIEWCSSISAALSDATGVVVAIPPLAQKELVEKMLPSRGIEQLIIEKPICAAPSDSIALMDAILAKSKRFRIGYSFLYTDWYRELKASLQLPAAQLRITWSFKADHFLRSKETWKRYHSMGGGVLRFYGIHVLATLAGLGYREITSHLLLGALVDQPETWVAQFSGLNVPPCTLRLSTNSEKNDFHVEICEHGENVRSLFRNSSPFLVPALSGGQDSRVQVLERLIRSLDRDNDQYVALYRATNDLWRRTELC